MTVHSLSAARSLCELRDWKLSNLELQKLLYLAEMYNLGLYGEPLIDGEFEAWDYGPVAPDVYARARGFGSGPIPNVFHWVPDVPTSSRDYAMLKEIASQAKHFSAGQLVNITHWSSGAWAKFYKPGVHGIRIPKSAIRQEYLDRSATQKAG
ncbi:MAG: Panacea domain-containing protein [Devosia sp.]